MANVRIPVIAFNSMTNLKPELIGLAAWLAATDTYPQDRRAIIEHVAEGGALDESITHKGFKGLGQVANAAKAHAEWLAFIAELEQAPAAKPDAAPYPHFLGRTNGVLPPLAGGAPINPASRDYDHMVTASTARLDSSEDIPF